MYGDPHFLVPLFSSHLLCYSIQGYPGLAFNLVYSKNFIVNAQFVDSMNDIKETTWIGKLAVIVKIFNTSNAVVFDSVKQEVSVERQGSFKAAFIKKIIFNVDGGINFIKSIRKKVGNPIVHVIYAKPKVEFDVSFYKNHLDINWSIQYDELPELHGLIG